MDACHSRTEPGTQSELGWKYGGKESISVGKLEFSGIYKECHFCASFRSNDQVSIHFSFSLETDSGFFGPNPKEHIAVTQL